MKSRFAVLLSLLVTMLLTFGSIELVTLDAASQSTPRKVPPAQWITLAGAKSRDITMLHFRKEIELMFPLTIVFC